MPRVVPGQMMLARGTARRKEIAMRLALGGGRARIIRQLITEALVLSILGGAEGLLRSSRATREERNAVSLGTPTFGPRRPKRSAR